MHHFGSELAAQAASDNDNQRAARWAGAVQQLIFDNLNSGVMALDRSLRVVAMNPAAESLLQVSEARIRGEPSSNIFADASPWLETLNEALEKNYAIVRRALALVLHAGAEVLVDMIATPLQESQEDAALIVELQHIDRLARISREESIINAQETTRAVVRGLAHEVKNPLGGIRGAAQLLAREVPAGALTEYTDIIIREADRLRNLVDRLLGPNRRPQLEQLNVHEIVEHVSQLMQAEAGDQLVVHKDYDPSLPDVVVDRSQMIQAVLNIVRNAMQAAQEIGVCELWLKTRIQRQFTIGDIRHRQVYRLDITDNGPGIPEEIQRTLFVPMVSGRPDGSGLGLSIAQSVINRHGGLLTCTSEPGQTRFSIYLPLGQENAAVL